MPATSDMLRALAMTTVVAVVGCSDSKSSSKSSSKSGAGDPGFASIAKAWKAADLDVELEDLGDAEVAIANGECRQAQPEGLSLRLCRYDDVLMADAARAEGEASIGAATGFALVRDRYLLIVADPDETDPHGKVMNELAGTFVKAADGAAPAKKDSEAEDSDGLSDLLGG